MSLRLPRRCRNANNRGSKPKAVYRTATEALEHARRGQEAYWCSHCCNYHVGTPKKGRQIA